MVVQTNLGNVLDFRRLRRARGVRAVANGKGEQRRNDGTTENSCIALATTYLSSQAAHTPGHQPAQESARRPPVRPSVLAFFESGIKFFASCRGSRPQGGTADHYVYIPRPMGEPGAESRIGHVTCHTCPDRRVVHSARASGLLLVELFVASGAVDRALSKLHPHNHQKG